MSSPSESLLAVYFEDLASFLNRSELSGSKNNTNRRFRSFFGISSSSCAIVWDLIHTKLPEDCHPKHLLWGLLFLKVYATESIHASLVQADEKTLRKWQWCIVKELSKMKMVRIY